MKKGDRAFNTMDRLVTSGQKPGQSKVDAAYELMAATFGENDPEVKKARRMIEKEKAKGNPNAFER